MKVRIKSYEDLRKGRIIDSYGDIDGFDGCMFASWMKSVCGMTATVIRESEPGHYYLSDFVGADGLPAKNIDEDIYKAMFTREMVEVIDEETYGIITASNTDGDYPGIKIEMKLKDGTVVPVVYIEKYPDDGKFHVSVYEDVNSDEPTYLGIINGEGSD